MIARAKLSKSSSSFRSPAASSSSRRSSRPRPQGRSPRRQSSPLNTTRQPLPILADLKSAPDIPTALELFFSSHPHEQDYPACSTLLYRLARSKSFQEVDTLLEFVRSRRVPCKDALFNALIKHYGKAGLTDKAVELFRYIPSFNCSQRNAPTVQSFNFLLDALVECGELAKAETFLKGSSSELGIRPNTVSYNVVIKGMLSREDGEGEEHAFRLLDEMIKRGVQPTVVTYNMLIGYYARSGRLDRARELKRNMQCRANGVTYALLMEGLCRSGDYAGARKMLFDMEYWGCRPRAVNYGVLMSDRGRNGDIEAAKELLAEMRRRKHGPDAVAYTILISCLCKERRVDEAYKVMVDMQLAGCQPGAAAYRMVLDGFVGVGEFEKGFRVMNAMMTGGHFPRAESLGRLVEGLCRAGKVEEARTVLEQMGKRGFTLEAERWEAVVNTVFSDGRDGCVGHVRVESVLHEQLISTETEDCS